MNVRSSYPYRPLTSIFQYHGAVHGARGRGQALRMQRANHRSPGTVGPERLRGAARWPGARPPCSCRRRDGPAWAAMSRLVPLCATLGRSFRTTLGHLVPLCATLCRRRPEWAALRRFRAKNRKLSSPAEARTGNSAGRDAEAKTAETSPLLRPASQQCHAGPETSRVGARSREALWHCEERT